MVYRAEPLKGSETLLCEKFYVNLDRKEMIALSRGEITRRLHYCLYGAHRRFAPDHEDCVQLQQVLVKVTTTKVELSPFRIARYPYFFRVSH